LQNFYFSQKADVQYKRRSLESNTKINSMLFAGKLISVVLPHKDLPHYEDFLGEDNEWRTSGSYEKLPWIKIDRIRNTPIYTERINISINISILQYKKEHFLAYIDWIINFWQLWQSTSIYVTTKKINISLSMLT